MAAASEQLGRLLALLPWLQAHPGVTKTAAAQAFGVSVAQLERDLKLAFTCELPGRPEVFIDIDYLDSDRISVLDPATIDRPLRLRSDEAVALLVGLRALAAVPGLQDRTALDGALAKLEDATGLVGLGPENPAPPPFRGDSPTSVAREALGAHRRLHLRYWVPTRDEVTERDVDPIRIMSVDNNAYLEGYCYASESIRTFRLDRVIEATMLDQAAGNAAEALDRTGDAAGVFKASPDDLLVTLDLARGARWVPEYYACETMTEQPDGRLRVTLRTGDPQSAVRLALRLGGACEVLQPAEVRAQVAQAAQIALAQYGVSHGV